MSETTRSTREECLERLRRDQRIIEPGLRCEVGPFRPGDEEGVSRLYFEIYGENFPVDYVYDPEQVKATNAGDGLHQVVARTERGDVVGLTALFPVAPNPRLMENGSLMLHPDYRGGKLGLMLLKTLLTDADKRYGIDAGFGQSVCDHLITQKYGKKLGWLPWALEVEAMPARPDHAAFGSPGGRISLLNQFLIYQDTPHGVHLPRRHQDFMKELYVSLEMEREFPPPAPLSGRSEWNISHMENAGLTRVAFSRLGEDLDPVLDGLPVRPGDHCLQLLLPLVDPGTSEAVDIAARRGFFLGGVLPLWTGADVLLLQRLAKRPDFEAVQLLTDRAKDILEAVRSDWEAVTGR
ncbi:MAG: GNAT family N-acetyltransferase [Desulfovibrionaceae bacterium]